MNPHRPECCLDAPGIIPVGIEITPVFPSTVSVDNLDGYVVTNSNLSQRKGMGIYYSQILSVFGLAVYCSTDSIGVGFFRNGTLYSLLDMGISTFFGTSAPEVPTIELVAALEIESDSIYIAAISSYGEEGSDVIFSSKSVNKKSLYNSASTSFITDLLSEGDILKQAELFIDYEYTGALVENAIDDIVCDETYSGGHGFSDITIAPMSFTRETGMKQINNIIASDINNIMGLDCIIDNAVSIGTASTEGGVFIFSNSEQALRVSSTLDGVTSSDDYLFEAALKLDYNSNLVHKMNITVQTKKVKTPSMFKHIFTKAGVFLEFKNPYLFSICRAEEKGLSSYDFLFVKDESGQMTVEINLNENGLVVPSFTFELYDPEDSTKWTNSIAENQVYTTNYRLNFQSNTRGEVGFLKGNVVEATEENGIISARSIQEIIEYS